MTKANHWLVAGACLLASLRAALGQPASGVGNDAAQPIQTNQVPAQGAELIPEQVVPPTMTNEVEAPPSANLNLFATPALQTTPTPTVPGSGLLGSPLMGTSVFAGSPAFGPSGGGGGGGGGEQASVLRSGPFSFYPSLGYSFSYGTGVESAPGQHTSTIDNTISPGLALAIGLHWYLDYSPSFSFYSANGFSDTTSQFVSLRGNESFEGWDFGLSQSYYSSSTVLVETGTQTSEVGYDTSLSLGHQLNDQLSFGLGASQSFQFTPGFSNVRDWDGSGSLNYQLTSRISTGLSLDAGFDSVSQGSDISYESVQGLLSFHPGVRTSLSFSGGAEVQQFSAGGAPSALTPIFSVFLSYLPVRGTTLTLSAARTVSPSFFVNQDVTSTTLTGGLVQGIYHKLTASVVASYGDSSYTAIVPGPLPTYYFGTAPVVPLTTVRSDTTTALSVGLQYAFRPRLNCSVFYSISQNSSSAAAFTYTSSQIGVQASYHY